MKNSIKHTTVLVLVTHKLFSRRFLSDWLCESDAHSLSFSTVSKSLKLFGSERKVKALSRWADLYWFIIFMSLSQVAVAECNIWPEPSLFFLQSLSGRILVSKGIGKWNGYLHWVLVYSINYVTEIALLWGKWQIRLLGSFWI